MFAPPCFLFKKGLIALTLLPLVVDLDGTLVDTDMLHESSLKMLRDTPLDLLRLPAWLMQGKAVLKQNLAQHYTFDPRTLPYNTAFIDWLRQQRAQGRSLVLCTASDHRIAATIAEHLGLFDAVIASDGKINLAGEHKAEALVAQFGYQGFDYAGNAKADLAVWQHANNAVVVNASADLVRQAEKCCEVACIFPPMAQGFSTWHKVFRVHQWLKNMLLFVPLLAAHQLANTASWLSLGWAFLAFSLCASSVYIANDLLDLESDRQHPRKCHRPFASGRVSIRTGIMLAPLFLVVSLWFANQVGGLFLPWLLLYFVLTCAYSWGLKRLMLVDCLTLAVLYTLRVVAGAAAVQLVLSFWLLAFSIFLFLSLAFVKRYAELEVQVLAGKQKAHGRGYYTSDAPLVQTLGIAAGYSAVLVLALYLNSHAVVMLYHMPEAVWIAIPILLFWVSWMWMQAHRGNMHDDPLVFAVKDKASLLAGGLFAVVMSIGARGLTWLP